MTTRRGGGFTFTISTARQFEPVRDLCTPICCNLCEMRLIQCYREWLGGFHKRKKAKTEERRSRAKERDRVAHREERRAVSRLIPRTSSLEGVTPTHILCAGMHCADKYAQAREELKKKAAENVRNVRMAMGLDATPDGQQDDSESETEEEEDKVVEDAYEDEDQIATVTIMEDFDPSQPGPSRRSPSPGSGSEAGERSTAVVRGWNEKENKRKAVGVPDMPASSRRAQKRAKSNPDKGKTEKRERGMETKAERKFGRAVEAKRRAKKAHIALERDGRQRGGEKGRRKGGKGRKRS